MVRIAVNLKYSNKFVDSDYITSKLWITLCIRLKKVLIKVIFGHF